jgi:nucleoside phosphorylase
MIAVTFALPTESSLLTSSLTNKRLQTCAGTEIIYGNVGSRTVAILHTGVGRRIFEKRIDDFLRQEKPEFLLSTGFAGGIDEALEVGDLFLAENFSDPRLLSVAEQIFKQRKLCVGKLFTSPSIAHSLSERNEIARLDDASAVDMETESIARVCLAQNIRMLSLRVISDTSREPFPAPPSVLFDIERQKTNLIRFAAYFVKHPTNIGSMVRFAGQIRRARENLTNALISLLQYDLLGILA